jgi:hypothetical protein
VSKPVVPIHGTDHRRGGPDPIPIVAHLHIKVFADRGPGSDVVIGDDAFVFAIAEDMNGLELRRVEAFVTTVSSAGIVQVQIRNRTQLVDLLVTRVQVDATELNSRYATTPAVIVDGIRNEWADEIAIDVDQGGSGAKGLGIILDFW